MVILDEAIHLGRVYEWRLTTGISRAFAIKEYVFGWIWNLSNLMMEGCSGKMEREGELCEPRENAIRPNKTLLSLFTHDQRREFNL
jgi:hypothetical protein